MSNLGAGLGAEKQGTKYKELSSTNPLFRKFATQAGRKNGIAPLAALLSGLWGDERCRKAPAYLFSEAVRTFTGVLQEV